MQLIGPALSEKQLLTAAYAYEQTNPLNGAQPDLEALVLDLK